ncbi:MAG: hypothetical protein ACE5I7_13400, partial [Candidatus Binatia bacterium]
QGTLLLNVATALDTVGHVGMDTHTSVVSFPCLGATKTLTCTPADSLCGGMPNTCVANDQPAPEDRVTITITVSNGAQTGCAMANEVQLVDSLPVGVGFANCTDDCVFNGTDVLWNLGGIGPGDSRAVAVTLRIEPNVGDGTVLKDVATATARDGAKAASTATITVRPPILMLTVVGSPSPVEPGGTLTYAFNLTNAGISCSAGVSLVDTLPTNAPFVLGSLDTTGCGVPAVSFSTDEPKFSITNFDLKAGERCTGSFRLFIPEDTALGQTLVNRISAIDSHLNAAPAAQVSTSVQTRLIGLSKIVSGCTSPPDGLACPDFSNVLTGSELSYSLTASTGPFTSTGVRVTDTLPDPAVATFVATDCPSMTLEGTVLVCSLGTIAANSSKTFRVIVETNDTNTPGTVITNMAMATNDAMDALGVSNSVTDAVDVVVVAPPTPTPTPTPVPTPGPELQIRITAPQAVRRGGRIRFEVEVRNVGNATAHSVVLTDTLPARLRLGRVPRVRGMRAACSGNKKNGTFTCNLGDLPPAQGRSLMVSTSVRRRGRQRGLAGDMINHRMRVASGEGVAAAASSLITVTAGGGR